MGLLLKRPRTKRKKIQGICAYAETRKNLHKAKEKKYVALSTLYSFTAEKVHEHNIGNMESICVKCGVLMFPNKMHEKCKTICLKELTPFAVEMGKSGSHPFQNLHFSFKIYYVVTALGPTILGSMFEHASHVLHLHQCP